MPNNRNLNRRIQAAIYSLKRLFGGEIMLYRQGDPVTNLETGEKTWPDIRARRIKKAIILPVKVTREQTQTISMISSDKKFVYGGLYDRGTRHFFIDARDLPPGYEIKRDDWIVYDGKKYEIKELQTNEFDALWEVIAVELVGVSPANIYLLTGEDSLTVDDAAQETVNGV